MKKANIKIRIIGHGLTELSKNLRKYGIYSECVIPSCNPLAMAGKKLSGFEKYEDDPNISMPVLLNLRKNLAQMLSRDPDNYCTNYNTLPYGADVLDCNTSSYLIIMNTAIAFPLFEKNGAVYSQAWTGDKFIDYIKSDKSFTVRRFPFPKDFNWKYYFDNFIDTVLEEYDNNHIILVKLNAAQWFMNETQISFFDKLSYQYRNLTEEMDDYFINRTKCLVIDEQYNHIPNVYAKNVFPYAVRSDAADKCIAKKIASVIMNGEAEFYNNRPIYSNRLAALLCKRLSKDLLKENLDNIEIIESNNITLDKLSESGYADNNVFFNDIFKLQYFLDYKNIRKLSEYALQLMAEQFFNGVDYELVELYTKYFKLDINDIIAFYFIYAGCEDKLKLRGAALNILNSSECCPVKKANATIDNNISYLKDYPYISDKFKENESEKLFISLENGSYLVFDMNCDNYLAKLDLLPKNDLDYTQVINKAYRCPIEYADALTYSYEYYAEKARRGDGKAPTYLVFADKNDFYDSLKYINYPDLLENERFVFALANDPDIEIRDYQPIVDFTILVDPNTALVNVRNGLGDQICHYVMGEHIAKNTGKNVVYFDLPALKFIGYNNGSDFKRIAKKPILAFSKMISERLSEQYNANNDSALSLLKRINNLNLIVNKTYYNHSVIKNELKSTTINGAFICDDVKRFVTVSLPYSYYFNLIRIEMLKSISDYKLSEYIEFPPFDNQEDIRIRDNMLSCDAIVVHIRRGDRVALGWNEDISFFVEAIQKIMALEQYKNKKFFVFSDDIKWCMENVEKIGLTQIGECELTFVTGHKGEECFRDVQLMTYGKVIMCGNSGFPRIAAIYSDIWEMFFCAEKITDDFIHNYVRKNKYDTPPFSKKDYAHTDNVPADSVNHASLAANKDIEESKIVRGG